MISRRQLYPVAAFMALSSFVLVGCGESQQFGEAEARPVTTDEAERLAVARFNNYDDHRVGISLSYTDSTSTMWVEGRVDFHAHVGYGNLLMGGDPSTYALMQWTTDHVAAVGATSDELPPQPPPDAPWDQRTLEASSSRLDATLAIVLSAATDRPENPLLLQQNGAQWLGKEDIDGLEVDVFHGPSEDGGASESLQYFVDDTGSMQRLVVNFPGGDGAVATINFLSGSPDGITTTINAAE